MAQPDHSFIIAVTSNGWHTGIVILRNDLGTGAIPEIADFPNAAKIEFGWGDADYYPARDPTIGMALTAALTPTPAVVHVIGLPTDPSEIFPTVERIMLEVSTPGFSRLIDYLSASFDRGVAERASPNAAGLYPFSLFYPATGRFHLFNTCNTWVARALHTAGLPVQVSGTLRAEDLMVQLRPLSLGRVGDERAHIPAQ